MLPSDRSGPYSVDNTSTEDFLDELKLEFTRTIDIADSLDSKANNLITMSGAIATLFLGFGTFLIGQLNVSDIIILGFALFFLLAEVVLTSAAIWRAISAYKLKDYFYPIDSKEFVHEKGKLKGELNDDKIYMFMHASKRAFTRRMTKTYLNGIKVNDKLNDDKANLIEEAHLLYLIALIMIVPFGFTLLIAKLIPLLTK